ncbi:MAG: hypothetical protein IOD05_07380 [Rhodobacter sp.]|nr:hypothetical protein [Rhodobacter sp.]
MSREDIICMMRSVCDTDKVDAWHNEFWTVTQDELDRFAALVAAHEREACAKVCEGMARPVGDDMMSDAQWIVSSCAAAIRKRGEVQP